MNAPTQAGADAITRVGVAEGEYFELRLEVGGRVYTRRSEGPLLATIDGRTVALDMAGASFAPNVDEKARFGALFKRGLAQPFRDCAPGDRVKVRVEGIFIAPGERIAVRVDAASGRVQALACGKAAEARVLRATRLGSPVRSPISGRPIALWPVLIPGVPGLGLAALAIAQVLAGGPAAAVSAGLSAAALLVVTLFILARRRFPPDLRTASEDAEGTGWRTSFPFLALIGGFVAGLGLLVGIIWHANGASFGMYAPFGFGGLAVFTAFYLVWLAITERRALARLWRIAFAPRAQEGRTGALDGRVVRGSVQRVRYHKYESEQSTDSEGRTTTTGWHAYSDSLAQSALEIALEGGGTLRVTASGGAFAACETRRQGVSLFESIGPGDHVRVYGRPSREGEKWVVAWTGPDSLLVLGSRKGPARWCARWALALHGSILFTLTAMGAVSGIAGLSAIVFALTAMIG